MNKLTADPSARRMRPFEGLSGETVLRRVLLLDGVVTGVNGVAYLIGAGGLDSLLGLSTALLRPVGGFLCLFAAIVVSVASRSTISRTAVRAVIFANVLWAVSSFVVAGANWYSPTGPGRTWIVLQATTVAAFAALQRWALGRDD